MPFTIKFMIFQYHVYFWREVILVVQRYLRILEFWSKSNTCRSTLNLIYMFEKIFDLMSPLYRVYHVFFPAKDILSDGEITEKLVFVFPNPFRNYYP
jgi:hypothetical protein